MSKTIRTKVFSYEELSEKAQKKALEQFRDIEVRHEWWDLLYYDFGRLCETFGVDVNQKQTFFRGFYSQGDGVAISADIDLKKLVEGIEGKVWEKEWGEEITKALGFAPCPVDKRVLKLFYLPSEMNYRIELRGKTQFTYSTTLVFTLYNRFTPHPLLFKQVEKLEMWLEGITKGLERYFYNRLENEYDWRTSDECVAAGIKANEYWFTMDGKWFPG